MDPSYFARFIQFVKSSFKEKFKAFLPGCFMGLLGSQHILWIGVPVSLVIYIWKFVGTVIMAFGSGLATAYGAYLVDQYKKKNNEKSKKGKGRKAA